MKFLKFAGKNVQSHFLSLEFCQVNHLQEFKTFCWPPKIVKLKKRQKFQKLKKHFTNFNKILLKIVILLSSEPLECPIHYPVSLFQALYSFTGSWRSINLKNEKKNQILLKFCNNSWHLKVENHSVVPINHAVTYYQTLKEVAWLLRQKKHSRQIARKQPR